MPAQCCRGKIARLNSGNSWSGYAPFEERPGLSDKIRAFCRKISNSIAALPGGLWTRFPGPRLLEAHKRQHQEKVRYARLAMVMIGIAIIARSNVGFERTSGAIDHDEAIQIPQSGAQSLFSAALAMAVVIVCIYLAVL